jgi:hypothetical protein
MQFTLRVPEDHGARYKDAAEAAGFATITDYLAHMLAEAHGLEFRDPVADDQQRLPLESGGRDGVALAHRSSAA